MPEIDKLKNNSKSVEQLHSEIEKHLFTGWLRCYLLFASAVCICVRLWPRLHVYAILQALLLRCANRLQCVDCTTTQYSLLSHHFHFH